LLSALAALPLAERAREELAQRRVRSDDEIAPLFLDPWRPVVGGAEYAAIQADLVRQYGIDRHFPAAADGLR
jgi:hypothetical protein